MRFIIACVGSCFLILIVIISVLTYNGKGFKSKDRKKIVKLIVKVKDENPIIYKRDLLLLNSSPMSFAFVGEKDSVGRSKLLTSVDSIVTSRTGLAWARDKFVKLDEKDSVDLNIKHRGSYAPTHFSSLFKSGDVDEIYREQPTVQDINNAISLGAVSAFLVLFLLTYFIMSISVNWTSTIRVVVLVSVFLVILIGVYASFFVGIRFNDALGDGMGIFMFHSLHWFLYGLSILTIVRCKNNFKSQYVYHGTLFLIIVFMFPLTHRISTILTPGLYEGYRHSFYYGSLFQSLVTIGEYMIASMGIGLAGLTIFGINNYKALKKNQALILQDQLRTVEQLNSLNARLNPHFLYNSLNAIAGLIDPDPRKAEEMTMAISRFLKHFSNRKEGHVITVREEVAVILDYISIERIRFEDKLSFDLSVEDEAMDINMPRSILQPLIENAVKYGYNRDRGIVSVRLQIESKDEYLTIRIYDSGGNFDTSLDKGYGISSVYNKLELLYKGQYSLEFVNRPKKHIEIIIPSQTTFAHA